MSLGRGGRRAKAKPLKAQKTHDGYMYVALSRNAEVIRFKTSRMVLEAFMGREDNLTANHKNGIRTDNRLENLEWATRKEQQQHAYKVLGRKGSRHKDYRNGSTSD